MAQIKYNYTWVLFNFYRLWD